MSLKGLKGLLSGVSWRVLGVWVTTAFLVLFGLLGLAGHALNMPYLTRWSTSPTAPPMALEAAVCFILLGVGFSGLLAGRRRSQFAWPVALAGLMGGYTVLRYALGDGRFDFLSSFVVDRPEIPMAYVTAVSLVLLSLGLGLLLIRGGSDGIRRYAIGLPGLLVLNMALFTLLGHGVALPVLYNFALALPSALALLVASMGLVVAAFLCNNPYLAAQSSRGWPTVQILILVVSGFAIDWLALSAIVFFERITGSPWRMEVYAYLMLFAVMLASLIEALGFRALESNWRQDILAQQQALAAEFGRIAMESHALPVVLNAALQLSQQALGLDNGAIAERLDPGEAGTGQAGGWRVRARLPAIPEGLPDSTGSTVPLSWQPEYWAVLFQQFSGEGDLLTFSDMPPGLQPLARQGEALLPQGVAIVLHCDDKPWGLIVLCGQTARPLATHDFRFLRSIAYRLSLVLAREHAERETADTLAALEAKTRELAESEETFRTLAESIPQLAWMARPDGHLFWYNRRWFDYTGTTLAEMEGWGWKKVHQPEHVERVERGFRQSLATGEPWEDTFPLKSRTGEWRWFLSRAVPIRDRQGNIFRWFGSNTDITELREAQQALKHARDMEATLRQQLEERVQERTAQLVASNRELEAFAYSVAHDLRAPLRSMNGFSQFLEEEYAERLDEKGLGYLRRIRENSTRMACLIDDLLELSRITRKPMANETVDITALALETLAELKAEHPERPVVIEVAPDLEATGDAELVAIALRNLLDNAWKFTRQKPTAFIRVGKLNENGHPVFFVEDNGAGFDMAYTDKLFRAFHRLHGQPEYPGTGIGLASAQRIIQRHGGRIWAEGAENRGATFYFTLDDK